jgi:hypothetical protein
MPEPQRKPWTEKHFKMLSFCKNNTGKVSYLCVSDLSRLSRDRLDAANTVALLANLGIELVSIGRPDIPAFPPLPESENLPSGFNPKNEKTIIYRGTRVIESYPQTIADAQKITVYRTSDGQTIPRTRFGSEHDSWDASQPCHDCCVVRGEFHVPGCDVEEYPLCIGQRLSCDCPFIEEKVG